MIHIQDADAPIAGIRSEEIRVPGWYRCAHGTRQGAVAHFQFHENRMVLVIFSPNAVYPAVDDPTRIGACWWVLLKDVPEVRIRLGGR